MTEMSGNDYIAQILKDEGVEYLMCFPSNPLISSAAKVGIRPVAFRHERGAVMAADGYSRMMDRQKFGVVAVQSQAGAENALGGMAQAYADNVPILVMLGGVNLNQISVRPNFTAVEKYQGFAKQIEAIYDITHAADVMRRAMNALRNGVLLRHCRGYPPTAPLHCGSGGVVPHVACLPACGCPSRNSGSRGGRAHWRCVHTNGSGRGPDIQVAGTHPQRARS